jgi:transducin (beta)-like 1
MFSDFCLFVASIYLFWSSGHTAEINQVKFNKQGTMLASCSDDCTARIWTSKLWNDINGVLATRPNGESKVENALEYPERFILSGHSHSVHEIRWCPCEDNSTEKLLATCVPMSFI